MWERERSEAWKRGDDWSGRRLRWLRDRLAVIVAKRLTDELGWTADDRHEILLTLLQSPDRFTCKVADDEYRGKGYSAWTWRINEALVHETVDQIADKINEGFKGRKEARNRGLAEEQYPSLPLAYQDAPPAWAPPTAPRDFGSIDNWLGSHQHEALDHVPVHEPHWLSVYSAAWRLGIIPHPEVQAAQSRMEAWDFKRRSNPWPRVCSKCGVEVRTIDGRQERAKKIRCKSCRRGGRAR